MKSLILTLVSCIALSALGQSGQRVFMKTGVVLLNPPSVLSPVAWDTGKRHVILGFHSVPDKDEFFNKTGIALWDYLPENAFYAALPDGFQSENLPPEVSGIAYLTPAMKADPRIWSQRKGEVVKIGCFPDTDVSEFVRTLQRDGFTVLRHYTQFNTVFIKRPSNPENILDKDVVRWAEPLYDSLVSENFPEMTDHRVNVVASLFPPGKGLTGKGISLGEWDAGDVGAHEDYNSRLKFPKKSFVHAHATHVCGTMAGAGNLDPLGRGMAPQSGIFCWNFYDDITTEMDTNFKKLGYTITQNSYSYSPAEDLCATRGDYDMISRELDLMVDKYQTLLHVFAAGNSRSGNCRSGGYHTVHSGFQSAKNVLTVGAVTFQDADGGFSSMGPTTDGRLKPEITAVGVNVYSTQPSNTYAGGWTGTSMACPGVSGSAALIQEFYKRKFNVLPPAHLVRNVMSNTADDLGNIGPDFKYGYGRINVARTIALLDSGRFMLDSVKNGRNDQHILKLPKGLSSVKIMLTWTDPAGSGTTKLSLVNDLDLILADSLGTSYKPWVLDTVNYNALAVRGRDSLNNMEQVTIAAPMAGKWKLEVRGKRVTTSFQNYSLTMDYVYPGVTMVYPNGFESMPPPTTTNSQIIRWDANGVSGNAKLEYSLNRGSTWQTLTTTVPVTQRYFTWTGMADTVNTSQALVRISLGSFQDRSDSVFSIYKTPVQPTPVVCDSQVTLKWPRQAGAAVYNLFQLNNGEMNVVYSGKDTFYTATKLNNNVTYWFALSAVSTRGAISMRTIAIPVVPVSTYIPPRITLNLKDTALCTGKTLILNSTVKGTAPITSFWQKSVDKGKSWTLVKANNDDTLILPNLKFGQSGILYQRVFHNLCQNKVFSFPAKVEVDTAAPVFTLPKDTLGCFGGSMTLRLQNLVSASVPWVYWQSSCKGGKPSGYLKHAREPFLTINNLSLADAVSYPVSARNGCGTTCAGIGCCGTRLAVAAPLKMSLFRSDTACLGEKITLSPDVMDGNPALYRYKWTTSDTTAVSSKLTLKAVKNTKLWLRMDDQGCSPTVAMDSMELWVREPLIATHSPDTTICFGTSAILNVRASGGDGTYTCSWDNGLVPGLSVKVSPGVSTVYHYHLTDSCSSAIITDSIRVMVTPQPAVKLTADMDTLCQGQKTTIRVLTSGGYHGKFSVHWQDGSADTVKSIFPRNDTVLICRISDGCSVPDPSDTIRIQVRAPLSVKITAPDSLCSGTAYKVNTKSTGGVPGKYTYAWNQGGRTSGSFSDSINTSRLYKVRLEDKCTVIPATDSVWVNIYSLPKVNAVRDTVLCFGEGTLLRRSVSGGKPGTLKTWWELNKALFTDSTLHINARQEVQWDFVANVQDGCGFSARDSVRVKVLAPLSMNPVQVRKCEYADSVIRFQTTGGKGGIRVSWADGPIGESRLFQNTQTAIYTALLEDGCSDSVRIPVSAEVKPLGSPVFQIKYIHDRTVGLAGTLPLINGTWDFGDGNSITSRDSFMSHTYNDYGSYTLCRTFKDEIGCHALHCETITLSDARKNRHFSPVILPNPFQGAFVIRFDKVLGQVEIQLSDRTGRSVLKEDHLLLFGTEIPVVTGELSAGIYYLKIRANGEEHLKKLLVH